MRGENHRQKGFGYQGMDCWKGKVLSCQNQGVVTIYALNKDSFERISSFHLTRFGDWNHANVASFGVEKVSRKDPFPVVYISQCHKVAGPDGKDVCYVERIAPDMKSSTLIQTIYYDDKDGDFGYALQWVVDRKRQMLYGYGNTVNNTDPSNRHRIIKFRLPKLSEGERVTLRPEDALENYTIEEASGFSFNPIGQGLLIKGSKLYMPTGVGTPEYPSILYIWDLRKKQMETVDLTKETTGEFEDIGLDGRDFIIQGQDGLFRVRL